MAIRESFLREIWGVVSFGSAKASNLQKFSLQKSYFHQFAKVFSLESFPLYGSSCTLPDATVHDDCVSASNFKTEPILHSVGLAVYLNVHLPAATRNDYILHSNVSMG